MSDRRAVIHNRRFWWLYSDGRMRRIYASDGLKSHLSYTNSAATRSTEEVPERKTNNPPRSPGTRPMLPAASCNIGDMTLTELAHEYGWGSVYRFTEALRSNRPDIYQQARDNGKARALSNLMTPTYGEQE